MRRRSTMFVWGQALMLMGLLAVTSYAQRGGGGGGGGGPGGFGGFGGMGAMMGGGAAGFATRPDVQKELDLNEDQIGKIAQVSEDGQQEIRDAMQDTFANFRDLSDEDRTAATEKMVKLNQGIRDKIVAELDATQKQRFNELEFQFNLQRNATQALTTAGVTIGDTEKEELSAALAEVERKVNEKVAAMRLEMQKEALAKYLGADKLEALLGKPFVFEQRGGGRGGFGGFGGGGGGGRGGRGNSDRPERPTDDAPPSGNNRRRGN